MPKNTLDRLRYLVLMRDESTIADLSIFQSATTPTRSELQELEFCYCYLYQNPLDPKGWRNDGFRTCWDCKSHWSYPMKGKLKRKIDKITLDGSRELHRWATQLNLSPRFANGPSRPEEHTFVEYFVKNKTKESVGPYNQSKAGAIGALGSFASRRRLALPQNIPVHQWFKYSPGETSQTSRDGFLKMSSSTSEDKEGGDPGISTPQTPTTTTTTTTTTSVHPGNLSPIPIPQSHLRIPSQQLPPEHSLQPPSQHLQQHQLPTPPPPLPISVPPSPVSIASRSNTPLPMTLPLYSTDSRMSPYGFDLKYMESDRISSPLPLTASSPDWMNYSRLSAQSPVSFTTNPQLRIMSPSPVQWTTWQDLYDQAVAMDQLPQVQRESIWNYCRNSPYVQFFLGPNGEVEDSFLSLIERWKYMLSPTSPAVAVFTTAIRHFATIRNPIPSPLPFDPFVDHTALRTIGEDPRAQTTIPVSPSQNTTTTTTTTTATGPAPHTQTFAPPTQMDPPPAKRAKVMSVSSLVS
eukprot:TRINITY_DN162_c0_g2_i2.p1 TRINITY_DN162_c0_g2~~TRINITY_DN162_c0_g2_i2.p1  ORF type:complete len:520 (+),score=45.91 TRINITY_DN162_c0_g2_i2:451-2010(+)